MFPDQGKDPSASWMDLWADHDCEGNAEVTDTAPQEKLPFRWTQVEGEAGKGRLE